MIRFLQDLAGAIFDFLEPIFYFIVGFIVVAATLYSIAKLFEWIL